jgi:ubiquinone/menaquinone biosynthesis C-methylase UbiE
VTINNPPIKYKWNLPERVEQAEWLDLGLATPGEVAESLAEVGRINKYLGGLRALTLHLYPRLQQVALSQGEVSLIDLGTGSGEIPALLFHWAHGQNIHLNILAIDLSPKHLQVAQPHVANMPNVQLLGADALALPLPAKSVDFVISSLFLHHLSPPTLVEVLKAANTVARQGVVMNDLVRGWMPVVAFKLVQPVFARSKFTRHDGAVSIRRAYTPAELKALAEDAGLSHIQVHTHWPWRMTLTSGPLVASLAL